jgi:ABC-type dipeptide/oligopeptide/nickel transport system ATPase component
MIIGINGKIGAGKDTVGTIIQGLLLTNKNQSSEIKKFAGKLKQIASILTGIPVENFEDQEFKKTILGSEWGTVQNVPLNSIPPFADIQFNVMMSVREFLQRLGTEAMRDGLHTNVWVNALFADYNPGYTISPLDVDNQAPDNWIITDMRFPNELESVEKRHGITIRVIREKLPIKHSKTGKTHLLNREAFTEHPSETALDKTTFDYEIINDGTMEELVKKVREILVLEELI